MGVGEPALVKRYQSQEECQREAAVLALLDGRAGAPRLLTVSQRVLAMEFHTDVTLKDMLRDKKMSDLQYMLLLEDVAKKLRELHSLGFVHGKLRSRDIFITFDRRGGVNAHLVNFDYVKLIGNPKHKSYVDPREDQREVVYICSRMMKVMERPRTSMIFFGRDGKVWIPRKRDRSSVVERRLALLRRRFQPYVTPSSHSTTLMVGFNRKFEAAYLRLFDFIFQISTRRHPWSIVKTTQERERDLRSLLKHISKRYNQYKL